MTDITSPEGGTGIQTAEAAHANAKDKRPHRILAGVLAVALAVGAGAGGGVLGTQLVLARSDANAAAQISTVPVVNTQQQSLEQVVQAVSPSVVTITVTSRGQSSLGSGVVLSKDGLILTNNHVVAGATASGSTQVQFADGTTARATIVGTDADHDLAVLRVSNVSGLTPVTLGDSSTVNVGDTVLAFGSPLGLQGTVTAGIVSAVDRTVDESSSTSLTGLIQTDAAINSGNSGGPLVDTAGRVIGINVAIATAGQDSGNIGLGFAIPAGTVQSVVDELAGAVR